MKRENPEDEINAIVDFLLHLVKEASAVREIASRAIRVSVNYLRDVIDSKKVKI